MDNEQRVAALCAATYKSVPSAKSALLEAGFKSAFTAPGTAAMWLHPKDPLNPLAVATEAHVGENVGDESNWARIVPHPGLRLLDAEQEQAAFVAREHLAMKLRQHELKRQIDEAFSVPSLLRLP